MPTYDSLTTRANSTALIAREDFNEIFKAATEKSAVLKTFRSIPVLTSQRRIPVMSGLPTAYWVSPTDVGKKETTSIAWESKYIEIEELATIVPVPSTVVADMANSGFSVQAELVPLLAEAAAVLIDNTVLFGTSKPSTWPTAIATAAASAGNTYTRESNAVNKGGIAEDLNQLIGKVEDDGYSPGAWITTKRFKKWLRAARDAQGQRLADMVTADMGNLYGAPIVYASPDVFTDAAGTAQIIGIDPTQFVVGVRQEMTLDVFNTGVISDGSGVVVTNLMQEGKIAVRMTMRLGWQVANPINRAQAVAASRYPAGALLVPTE